MGCFPYTFHCVFENEVYKRWVKEEVGWQLHYVGRPGVGKVAMANARNINLTYMLGQLLLH